MQKTALVNSTMDTLKKPRLKDRTDRAWFNCLLQHPARKHSRSNLSTLGARRQRWRWQLGQPELL